MPSQMNDSTPGDIESLLATYRVGEGALYIVGSFDSGVTVYSQQVRALNLVWALVERGVVPCALSNGQENQLGDTPLHLTMFVKDYGVDCAGIPTLFSI